MNSMIAVFLMLAILLIAGCNIPENTATTQSTSVSTSLQVTTTYKNIDSSPDPRCEAAGGTWKRFGTDCGDFCGITNCIITDYYSCDCGPDKCWDSNRDCVPTY